jgi:hypothetical protein
VQNGINKSCYVTSPGFYNGMRIGRGGGGGLGVGTRHTVHARIVQICALLSHLTESRALKAVSKEKSRGIGRLL